MSAQEAVELTAPGRREVTLAASELQPYLDGMPRLLTEAVFLTVTGELDTKVAVKNFYGPGTLTIISGEGFTLRNHLRIIDCSVFIYLHSLEFRETAAMGHNDGLVDVTRSGFVYVYKCGFTGRGAESACVSVSAKSGSRVMLGAVRVSGLAYTVLAGNGSILSVDPSYDGQENEFQDNIKGAYAWNGGIILLGTGIPDTLGGAANVKLGGIIAKGDGTLL